MDRVVFPPDVGVELDCLLIAFDVVIAINNSFKLVVFLVAKLFDVVGQLADLKLLACHHLERVAHGVA